MAGFTTSTGFGSANPVPGFLQFGPNKSEQGFVTKVTSSGALGSTTYLGGSTEDYVSGIAVDNAGNALVTGTTYSTDFAGASNTNHGSADVFVAKVPLFHRR